MFNGLMGKIVGLALVFGFSAAQGAALQPGDLAILFDQTETLARRDRLISLKDLGISQQDMTAILIHARHDLVITNEWKRNSKGYEQDREINQGDESFFRNSCFMDLNNWKVSAIRFAPFEYSIPGSPEVIDAYAKATGTKRLDQAFELRFTLTPLCPRAADDLVNATSLDAGLHLIYNIWPEDPVLRKSLLEPLQLFLEKGNNEGLKKHIGALTSKEYRIFHAGLIDQLNELAKRRGQTNAVANALNQLYVAVGTVFSLTTLTDEAEEIEIPALSDRATLPLRWKEGQAVYSDESYFEALKKMSIQMAKRKNLTRVATNFLHGGDSWQMAGLLAHSFASGVFHQKDEAKARKIFVDLFPQELKTVQAVMDSKKQLVIKDVSTSGYYADLSIPSLNDYKEEISGVEIRDQKLFGFADFYQGMNRIGDSILLPSSKKEDLIPLNRLMNNVARTNAHTTSCSTCHTITVASTYTQENGTLAEEISSVFSPEPQHNVRMLGFSREEGQPTVRSITINQVKSDMKKLKDYLK